MALKVKKTPAKKVDHVGRAFNTKRVKVGKNTGMQKTADPMTKNNAFSSRKFKTNQTPSLKSRKKK